MRFGTLLNPVFKAKVYEIFDRRGRKLGEINAESPTEALRIAKEMDNDSVTAILKT